MSQYSPLQPGDPPQLGHYELVGRLGQGGMGVVFLGQDDLGRVAIKTIKSMNVGDERAMRLFRREVDAARRVPRRCTAQLFEYDLHHVPPFIVSEYIKGPTLEAEVRAHGPLPASKLHGVAIGVAAALSEIHRASIVHGDLTPRNVLLSPDGPRVIDFGIARIPEQTTSSGKHIVGTLAYMSPEHLNHGQISTAADVFAWGSVMAFVGTGRPPFGQGPSPQIIQRILHEPPDLTGLDLTIRPFVEAALHKEPARRPTAAWLQKELKKAARTAADQLRIAEVTKVLQSAQQGSDRPIPMVGEPMPSAHRDGFPRRLTGSLLLLAATVLILGAWLDTLGGLGTAARGLARWLFGYGTYVLPLLVGWWAVAVLLGPSTVPLWPEGWEALWEPSARSVGRAAWSAIRTITHSPVLGGMAAVFLGGLGLLHLARGMPPANGSYFELSQSGGFFGAALVGILNPLLSPRIARIFLVLLLLAGATAVAWPIRRRFGTGLAAAALALCLGVATGPAIYLKDNHYPYWIRFDTSGRIAVFRGLAVERARFVKATSTAKDDIPSDLWPQVSQGVPAWDLEDGQRLANAIPRSADQPLSLPNIDDRRGEFSVGTCLDRAASDATRVDCSRLHGAEVFGLVTPPYNKFPGKTALQEYGSWACRALFDPYVGVPYEQTTLDFDYLLASSADWESHVRTVVCLLKPTPAQELRGSLRDSRLLYAADFTTGDQWSADTDNNTRCQITHLSDGTLSLAKGTPGFLDKKQAGLLCVATPIEGNLASEYVTDAQLKVTAAPDEPVPAADRVGFVCREGTKARYHLTTTRAGSWRIEKAKDGQLITLKAGTRKGVVPATGPISLRAACSGGEDGAPVKLTLWANSKLLGRASDAVDPLSSGTVGVAIVAADPDAFSAAFDDFTASTPSTAK
jgi:hypothetical protein